MNTKKLSLGQTALDFLISSLAGIVVAIGYYFFQNSNGFAPGGVGGLATITYYLLDYKVSWALLMLIFNIPIFVLLTIFVNRMLGINLIIYMFVQSLSTELFEYLGFKPYCLVNNTEDFEMSFACIATGVIAGLGFSIMLRRFGASGGTYAISAIIKRFKPAANIANLAFFLDGSVVIIAFFVYGFKITPTICTFINLFVATVVVNTAIKGGNEGFKFEIITDKPEEISEEIITTLKHGVTEIRAMGMYSHTEKHLLVCIVRKKNIGSMMKIIKKYKGTFASFSTVNEVFGRFRK